MKTTIKLILAGFAFAATAACTGNYEDINRNPYEVTDSETERDAYNLTAALVTLQNNVLSTEINRLQQTDCLLGGAWGRYMAESKASSWEGKFSTLNPPTDWSCVVFNEIVPQVYPALTKIKNVTKDPVPIAISNILKVMALHRVTDTYGPIPYSKIGEDGKVQVAYDSQQVVYETMFAELTSAIDMLTLHVTESISPNADQIYRGDLTKWVRLANSLKLRLAMRVVYVQPDMAQRMAEEAVNHSIGVMTANSDNAALNTFGAEGNPMNVVVKYNIGDHRAIADLTLYMNSYADPRRDAYFEKSGFTELPYSGFRSGVRLGGVEQFQKHSIFKMDKQTPLRWLSVAEVMFLRAEGAMRHWNMGGTAESFYTRAVELSFDQWGVTGASAYLANTTEPTVYTDPTGLYSYNDQVSTITVKWDEGASDEVKLERIITQKWIANFPLGLEAWADMRRTGYPKVMPVVVNGSAVLKNGDTPRRCPYPIDEAINNAENYAKAVEMLGGADNIATRVWWDCK